MDTVAAQAGGLPEAAPLPVPAGIPPPAIVPLPRNPTPRAVRDCSTALFRPVSRHQLLNGRSGTGVPRSRRHSIINQGIFIMIKGIFSSIEKRVRP